MSFIQWSEDWNTGILAIDKQHQKLVEMINELNKGIADGETLILLSTVFNQLTQYIAEHFAYEEALFTKHGYPHSEAHIKTHHEFIKQIDTYKAEFEMDPGSGTAVELMHYLSHWLINHICKTDKDYAAFLTGKGEI